MRLKSSVVNFRSHPVLLILIPFFLPLVFTACGSGGDSPGGSSTNPSSTNLCLTTPAGQTLSGKLPGSGGTFANGSTTPVKGSVTIDVAGNFVYTPFSGLPSGDGRARGKDVFSYRVTSGSGSSEGFVTVFIDGAVRIMPLGDSITAGVSGEGTPGNIPADQQVSYRRKLYNDLTSASSGYGINFVGSQNSQGSAANPPLADRDHEGHPGWCDDNNPFCSISGGQTIDTSITSFLNGNPPDIILLHIGTNHFDVSASGVNSILDKINAWAQANYPVSVFLARIIPSRDGSLDVNTFNDNVQAVAGNRSATRIFIVDQQSVFRLANNPNQADPALMGDNLHPTQTGYDRMADRWRSSISSSGVLPTCQ